MRSKPFVNKINPCQMIKLKNKKIIRNRMTKSKRINLLIKKLKLKFLLKSQLRPLRKKKRLNHCQKSKSSQILLRSQQKSQSPNLSSKNRNLSSQSHPSLVRPGATSIRRLTILMLSCHASRPSSPWWFLDSRRSTSQCQTSKWTMCHLREKLHTFTSIFSKILRKEKT